MICVQGANERKCPCMTFFPGTSLQPERLMAVLVSVSEGRLLGYKGGGEEVGQRVTYIVSCIHKTNMKYSVYDLGERVKGVFSPGMMIGS